MVLLSLAICVKILLICHDPTYEWSPGISITWAGESRLWESCRRKLSLRSRPFSCHRSWFLLSMSKCKSPTTVLPSKNSPKRVTFHHDTCHLKSCSTYWIIPPWCALFIFIIHNICYDVNLLIVFSPFSLMPPHFDNTKFATLIRN